MSYLTRLKRLDADEISRRTLDTEPTKPTEPTFDGSVGSTPTACENFSDVCEREMLDWPDPFPDDRRPCTQCSRLNPRGRCIAAQQGEIVANQNYVPIRDLPRRCEGYMPSADDADRRPGRKRWPGLIEKGCE